MRVYKNGRYVELSAEEEAAHVALQEQIAAEQAARVPAAVTPLQMRRALRAADLMVQVEALVEQLDDEAREAWEYAVVIHRNDPLITSAAEQLDLTSAQVDDLFRAAAQM